MWLGLFLFLPHYFLKAQDESSGKKSKEKVILHIDTLGKQNSFSSYRFKHTNTISRYYNSRQLKEIKRLERQKKWKALCLKLKKYVMRFGIQNFYIDTYWIWRLAKLTEWYGSQEEARALYRLALRHHHQGVDLRTVELYYDSLNTQETENFVPLDYYYKLVEHRKAMDTIRPPRGVLLNMGRKINSRQADYAPSLNSKGDLLLFTSKRNKHRKAMDEKANEDLFISTKQNDYWQQAADMSAINTPFNEGSACLSKDGKTLFFARCDSPDSMGSCDLFTAQLNRDSVWTAVQNLGPEVNSISWDSHPSLSHSEDTLFFASDRIGGFGLSDIYFTYKNKRGEWMPAQNLGPIINTRKNEVSPFYHPTHSVLFFSSDGQLYNFGAFDIYKAYHRQDQWSEPLNIGPLVNGKGSEFYFTIDSESKNLFYARSATGDLDKQDLYSFPLPMEAQPEALIQIEGSLTDSLTSKPFSGIVSVIDLDQGIPIAPKYLHSDGSFRFNLVNHRNYLLVIQGDEFFRIEEMFYLDGPETFHQVTEPIASKVKFESIAFDTGEANLKQEMYGDLNKIINFMYDNPDFYLKISGHTDRYGSGAVNLKLSKDRAETIRDYVVIFGGISTHRVDYQGYGSSQPIVEEITEQDRNLNRRVEFEIYRPKVKKEEIDHEFNH